METVHLALKFGIQFSYLFASDFILFFFVAKNDIFYLFIFYRRTIAIVSKHQRDVFFVFSSAFKQNLLSYSKIKLHRSQLPNPHPLRPLPHCPLG